MTGRFLILFKPSFKLYLGDVPILKRKALIMERKSRKGLLVAAISLAAFVVWTVLVCTLDVAAIGPQGSEVGFASFNGSVHSLTGVHMWLYTVTDWLGLVPIAVALGFGILGLCQWIKRKSLLRVDRSILALGIFYVAVMAAYVLFEFVVINYRPVLIDGHLEASYPSSTTMLTLCVMPTAAMQLQGRIRSKSFIISAVTIISVFTAFMVLGRLICGVHWASDIIGGVLLSASLVAGYAWGADYKL